MLCVIRVGIEVIEIRQRMRQKERWVGTEWVWSYIGNGERKSVFNFSDRRNNGCRPNSVLASSDTVSEENGNRVITVFWCLVGGGQTKDSAYICAPCLVCPCTVATPSLFVLLSNTSDISVSLVPFILSLSLFLLYGSTQFNLLGVFGYNIEWFMFR